MEVKNHKNKSILYISAIKLLIPAKDKIFYLNIIINEEKSLKSKNFTYRNSNIINLNQAFELDDKNFNSHKIIFQIYEKSNIFSSVLYKSEVINSETDKSLIKDKDDPKLNNKFECYLTNCNKENSAIVYYVYDFNPNLLDTYDKNLKILEKEHEENLKSQETKSFFSNIKDLTNSERSENFMKFIHNMEYYRSLENSIDELMNWKDSWKTLCCLFIFTISLIYWKVLVVLFPVIIIFFHIFNKDDILKFSHKNTKHDQIANIKLISKIIEFTNKIINYYENFLEALHECNNKIFEEIYVNLLKMIIFNFIIIYFRLFNLKLILILVVWTYIVWKNPSFKAFLIFFINFINKKFLERLTTYNLHVNWEKAFFNIVPFYNIFRKIYKIKKKFEFDLLANKNSSAMQTIGFKEMLNDTVACNINNSSNSQSYKVVSLNNEFSESEIKLNNQLLDLKNSQELIKFEIYENERWWMFVGWAKKLIMNERPLWSDLTGKIYLAKDSVFLPDNDKSIWLGDWKVEVNDNCDSQGWEYANDFKSEFQSKSSGKYVRRKKWVRYAKYLD